MRNLKNEIKMAVFGKGMLFVVFISVCFSFVLLNFYYDISFVKTYIKPWSGYDRGQYSGLFVGTITRWTFFTATPYYVYVIYLMPVIAIIPYGSRVFFERRSGNIKNSLIRESRLSYGIKKYIATFISGGLAVMTPPAISLASTYAVKGIVKASPATTTLVNPDWFHYLLFTHSWLYVLLALFTWFVYGGLLVSISMLFSLVFDSLLTIVASPLFIYLVVSYIDRDMSFGNEKWRRTLHQYLPRQVLNPLNSGETMLGLGIFAGLSLVNFIVYILAVRRQEVY